MEETHNYAMNLIVPLMGIAPLLMVFILKGEKKTKRTKNWTRSVNQKHYSKTINKIFYVQINFEFKEVSLNFNQLLYKSIDFS